MSTPDENPYAPPADSADCELAAPSFTVRRGLSGVARQLLAAACGFLLGFAVWAGSRFVTGCDEPWDAGLGFYCSVLNFGGIVGGAFGWRSAFSVLAGIWLGQCAALLFVPWLAAAGWFELGVVTTAIGSLTALPGLLLGAVTGSAIVDS